jgi:hypothetical protein
LGGLIGALINDSGAVVLGLMVGPMALALATLALEPAYLSVLPET